MGSASSIQLTPQGSAIIEESEFSDTKPMKKDYGSVRRNQKINHRIFDRQETNEDMDINSLLDGDYVDDATRTILIGALKGFFFLQGTAEEINPKMDLLIRGMKKEEFPAGELLINEGESGSKLYVVESGSLEVTINGTVIREMSKGSMLGELALLYDAPRSATVQCKTSCVLWSLTREIFKKVQAISGTANQIQRARWLIASPELAVLSPIDLSRLVGTLQLLQFKPGDKIYTEGEVTSQVILIEKGHASISSSRDLAKAAKNEIDKSLGILRPREGKRRSVEFMNAAELGKYIKHQDDTSPISPRDETKGIEEKKKDPNSLCEVYDGCMLGIGALRGKANMSDCWKWVKGKDGKPDGAESPLTMTATTPLIGLVFTVEVFENLFGSVEKAIQVQPTKVTENPLSKDDKKHKEIIFDSTKFKSKFILGSGSFGVVTLAEYRAEKNQPPQNYALKSLSKLAVIETGQLRHVLDERKILSIMDSPFILTLYGTYQTPHQLVMVTEPLNCGDLWSVVYETPPFCDISGVPFTLAAFYATVLVYALSHIHDKGVIFRDLKPENIMLDEKGYLRVIDFGFAKKVPYTKVDANGEVKVYAKTYTLCGTPGKLYKS